MDPVEALRMALLGDKDAREAYNEWVKNDGYKVDVKVWTNGTQAPLVMTVSHIGPALLRGTVGLVFPKKAYVPHTKALVETVTA